MQCMLERISTLPLHLSRFALGDPNSEVVRITTATNNFQGAIFDLMKDGDHYAFGKRIYPIILSSEMSVLHFNLPQPSSIVPWIDSNDALRHAAKAIRERGNPDELDIADTLEVHWSLSKGPASLISQLTDKALQRNPNHPYFLYIRTMGSAKEPKKGLQLAERGLKCKDLTTFVRLMLLCYSLEHAFALGYESILKSTNTHDAMAYFRIACQSALLHMKRLLSMGFSRTNLTWHMFCCKLFSTDPIYQRT
jgi:hypothetical protein